MLLCRFGEGRKCLHNTTKKPPFLVSWEKALGHKKARYRSKKLIAAFLFIFSLLVHLVSCKTCYAIPSYVISEAQNDNGSISNCLPLRFKFKKNRCCQNCFSSNRRNNFFFFIYILSSNSTLQRNIQMPDPCLDEYSKLILFLSQVYQSRKQKWLKDAELSAIIFGPGGM